MTAAALLMTGGADLLALPTQPGLGSRGEYALGFSRGARWNVPAARADLFDSGAQVTWGALASGWLYLPCGTSGIQRTRNGIDFERVDSNLIAGSQNVSGIVFDGTNFGVIRRNSSAFPFEELFFTTDFSSWTKIQPIASYDVQSISYTNSRWFAICKQSSTWRIMQTNNPFGTWSDTGFNNIYDGNSRREHAVIVYGDGVYAFTSDTDFYYSSSLLSWNVSAISGLSTNSQAGQLSNIEYLQNQTRFVAVAQSNQGDGELFAITSDNAFSSTTNNATGLFMPNGVNADKTTLSQANGKLYFGYGSTPAQGSEQRIAQSTDGLNWSYVPTPIGSYPTPGDGSGTHSSIWGGILPLP